MKEIIMMDDYWGNSSQVIALEFKKPYNSFSFKNFFCLYLN